MDEADGRDHGLKPPSTTIKIAGLQLARTTCPLRSSASMRSDPLFTKEQPFDRVDVKPTWISNTSTPSSLIEFQLHFGAVGGAKSSRLRDTGLVHTATSGEQQVADFVGFLEAARQSLPLRQT